jgi:molybdate transport system substrate-binding protein
MYVMNSGIFNKYNCMTQLQLISAGAAMGLVRTLLADQYSVASSNFGAVGAMQERFLSGQACDLLILTRTQLDALAARGLVGNVTDLGWVSTGLAVCSAQAPAPPVTDESSLRSAIAQASALFVPDMQRSTAGQHVAQVLAKLGLTDAMRDKLREHPNGATAMKAMAESGDVTALGCTQATEILYTTGVRLTGLLPPGFELATRYAAAVPTASSQAEAAAQALHVLCGESNIAARNAAGFA